MKANLGRNGISVKRSAEGIRIPASIVRELTAIDQGVALSWTTDARRFIENRSKVASAHSDVFRTLGKIKSGGRRSH